MIVDRDAVVDNVNSSGCHKLALGRSTAFMRLACLLLVLVAFGGISACRKGAGTGGGADSGTVSGAVGNTPPANEFERFAENATMDSYLNEIQFDRTAPWRASKLTKQQWTDPNLKEAVDQMAQIAYFRYIAVLKRDGTYWTNQEIGKSIRQQIFGNETQREDDLIKNLKLTTNKVKQLQVATEEAFGTRVAHSIVWSRVLERVHPVGGPNQDEFPLTLGLGFGPYVLNNSQRTLNHLTLAVRTNISKELPDDARLHVVHLERLEPGEWFNLPTYLASKIKDTDVQTYRAESNAWRVSVWSTECQFEDVDFDVQPLPNGVADPKIAPNGWCSAGFFPTLAFKGKYAAKGEWAKPTLTPRSASLRGLWQGEDPVSKRRFELRFEHLIGSDFSAVVDTNLETDGKMYSMLVHGKLRGNKIDFEYMFKYPGTPNFPSHYWGTIDADQMDLTFGDGDQASGTVLLKFLKARE